MQSSLRIVRGILAVNDLNISGNLWLYDGSCHMMSYDVQTLQRSLAKPPHVKAVGNCGNRRDESRPPESAESATTGS